MPTSSAAVNPTALPNVPPTPPPANPAITQTPAQIQEQIARMQQQVLASASPTGRASEQSRLGIPATQSPQAPQTTPAAPSAPQPPPAAPATTAAPAASASVVPTPAAPAPTASAPSAPAPIQPQPFNAGAMNTPLGVIPPPGMVYDPSVNAFRDPISRNFYAGIDPSLGTVFTPDQRTMVENMANVPDGGVMTTAAYRAGVASLDAGIQKAITTPLPSSGADQVNGGVGSQSAFIASLPPDLQPIQAQIDQAKSYMDNPDSDPAQQMLKLQEKALSDKEALKEANIHQQASNQLDVQSEANRQALERNKVFFASIGGTNSSQFLQYTSDTIRQNEKALKAISDSERMAIQEAQIAFQDNDMQLAVDRLNLVERRRKDYTDLAIQGYQLKQQYQNDLLNRKQFQLQLDQMAQDKLDKQINFAVQAGQDWDALTPTMQQNVMNASGLNQDGARAYFASVRSAADIAKTKDMAAANKAWMDTIQTKVDLQTKMLPDQSFTETMPDGTKVTFNGMKPVSDNYSTATASIGNGQYLITHDKEGNLVKSVFLGNNTVAPHFNSDTGTWETYDPNSNTTTETMNPGTYGEGYPAISNGVSYVDGLTQEGFKVTQEPGGGFSHQTLTGWDVKMPVGTHITSPVSNGTVVKEGYDPNGYGHYADIQNIDTGEIYRFGHLSKTMAQLGSHVDSGTVIGLSGGDPSDPESGLSTGAHLHFELRTADDKAIIPNRNDPSAKKPVKPISAGMQQATPSVKETIPPPDQRTDQQWIQAFEESRGGLSFRPESRRDRTDLASFRKSEETAARQDENTQRQALSTITRDPNFVKTTEAFSQRRVAKNEFDTAYNMAIQDPSSGVAARQLMASLERVTHPNPTTVIRSSEIQNLENSASLPQQALGYLSMVTSGQKLQPAQINDMKTLADNAILNERKEYDMQIGRAYEQAIRMGIDPRLVGYPVKTIIVTSPQGNQMTADSIADPELVDAVKNQGYTLQVITE